MEEAELLQENTHRAVLEEAVQLILRQRIEAFCQIMLVTNPRFLSLPVAAEEAKVADHKLEVMVTLEEAVLSDKVVVLEQITILLAVEEADLVEHHTETAAHQVAELVTLEELRLETEIARL